MDTYSHLLEDIGGDAVGGLDEAFGKTGCSTVAVNEARRFDRASRFTCKLGVTEGARTRDLRSHDPTTSVAWGCRRLQKRLV
jgi:hypothetical protein